MGVFLLSSSSHVPRTTFFDVYRRVVHYLLRHKFDAIARAGGEEWCRSATPFVACAMFGSLRCLHRIFDRPDFSHGTFFFFERSHFFPYICCQGLRKNYHLLRGGRGRRRRRGSSFFPSKRASHPCLLLALRRRILLFVTRSSFETEKNHHRPPNFHIHIIHRFFYLTLQSPSSIFHSPT